MTGVSKALFDLGLLDHASWNAGISGGSWYVSSHYLNSRQRSDRIADPADVISAIQDRLLYSIYGDTFQGNEVRPSITRVRLWCRSYGLGPLSAQHQVVTDILFTPFLYDSRLPDSSSTRQILCECKCVA